MALSSVAPALGASSTCAQRCLGEAADAARGCPHLLLCHTTGVSYEGFLEDTASDF